MRDNPPKEFDVGDYADLREDDLPYLPRHVILDFLYELEDWLAKQ